MYAGPVGDPIKSNMINTIHFIGPFTTVSAAQSDLKNIQIYNLLVIQRFYLLVQTSLDEDLGNGSAAADLACRMTDEVIRARSSDLATGQVAML